MNVNDIYPSKYVKAHDLGDKNVTVTISRAVMEELGYGKDAERKLVIYFEKASKGLILNRTNAMIIAGMYTPETDNWIGKAVILYAARVKAFGQWHDAVRVKEQIPARNTGAAKMPEAMVEAPPIDDEEDVLDVDEGNPLAAGADSGSYEDPDVLFMPDTGPERATVEQLERLHTLGFAFYKSEWTAKLRKLVEHVTTGATDAVAQLSPAECDRLIRGIESKQAAVIQSTNGAAK